MSDRPEKREWTITADGPDGTVHSFYADTDLPHQRVISADYCEALEREWGNAEEALASTEAELEEAEARIESLESGLRGLTETLERFGELKIDAWRGEQKAAIKLGRDLLHGNQTKEGEK